MVTVAAPGSVLPPPGDGLGPSIGATFQRSVWPAPTVYDVQVSQATVSKTSSFTAEVTSTLGSAQGAEHDREAEAKGPKGVVWWTPLKVITPATATRASGALNVITTS
jgi:hypothetical protein